MHEVPLSAASTNQRAVSFQLRNKIWLFSAEAVDNPRSMQAVLTAATALGSVSAVYISESTTVHPKAILEEAACKAVAQLLPCIAFAGEVGAILPLSPNGQKHLSYYSIIDLRVADSVSLKLVEQNLVRWSKGFDQISHRVSTCSMLQKSMFAWACRHDASTLA